MSACVCGHAEHENWCTVLIPSRIERDINGTPFPRGCGCTVRSVHDAVERPAHYTWHPAGIECRTIVEHFSFWTGSAIAYIWRHNHKGNPIEDLKKARASLDHEIARLERDGK